jgi:hypothetical protein
MSLPLQKEICKIKKYTINQTDVYTLHVQNISPNERGYIPGKYECQQDNSLMGNWLGEP